MTVNKRLCLAHVLHTYFRHGHRNEKDSYTKHLPIENHQPCGSPRIRAGHRKTQFISASLTQTSSDSRMLRTRPSMLTCRGISRLAHDRRCIQRPTCCSDHSVRRRPTAERLMRFAGWRLRYRAAYSSSGDDPNCSTPNNE